MISVVPLALTDVERERQLLGGGVVEVGEVVWLHNRVVDGDVGKGLLVL